MLPRQRERVRREQRRVGRVRRVKRVRRETERGEAVAQHPL